MCSEWDSPLLCEEWMFKQIYLINCSQLPVYVYEQTVEMVSLISVFDMWPAFKKISREEKLNNYEL